MAIDASNRSWLRCNTSRAECSTQLICLGPAGSGASTFSHWIRLLPAHVRLLRVQLPGREDAADLPFAEDIDVISGTLSEQLSPELDGPFVIYGHSLGALLAFELTRALRKQRRRPVALVVSGRRAPHVPVSSPLYCLDDVKLSRALLDMGGMPSTLLQKADWREAYFARLRADLKLTDMYAYRNEPPLDCPITAYLGDNDRVVEQSSWLAWAQQTTQAFRAEVLPGRHIFSVAEQQALIGAISEWLSPATRQGQHLTAGQS